MSEKKIINDVALFFTRIGGRAFRNNVGQAWQGRGKAFRAQMPISVRLNPGDVVLRQAVPVKYGLLVGSADQICWRTLIITTEMVGKKIAQFCSIESKDGKNVATKEQITWKDNVLSAGGYARIIHDVSELSELENKTL